MKPQPEPKRKVRLYLSKPVRITLQKLSRKWRVTQDDALECAIIRALKFFEFREKLDLKLKGSLERL